MNSSKRCSSCGRFFTPCSPFSKAAASQKYCSRPCSNKGNGKARRGRKWGQPSRQASEQAGIAPNTVYVRLTGARQQTGRMRQIDGLDAFDDVKRAVKRAYARMIEQGRILETPLRLWPRPNDKPETDHAEP